MPVKHTEKIYLGKKRVHCPGEGKVLRMGLSKVWGPAETLKHGTDYSEAVPARHTLCPIKTKFILFKKI